MLVERAIILTKTSEHFQAVQCSAVQCLYTPHADGWHKLLETSNCSSSGSVAYHNHLNSHSYTNTEVI